MRGASVMPAGPGRAGTAESETATASATRAPAAASIPIVALGALLTLFALYPDSARGPFFSDDYMLLDKVRNLPFGALFAPRELLYGYWRPWSRELHFWLIEHLFGARPLAFHVASLALALAAILLYAANARRLLGTRGAVLTAAAVAGLAAWVLPVRWASAAQDLWMLVLALGSLLAFAGGRTVIACVTLTLALLSKETAAVIPAITFAYAVLIQRTTVVAATRRVLPLALVTLVWLVIHPALGGRAWWGHGGGVPLAAHQSPVIAMVRSVLASLNLDALPRPRIGWLPALGLALPGTVLLAKWAVWAVRRPVGEAARAAGAAPQGPASTAPSRNVAMFGIAWALIAWIPLALPFLIWQPYYILFGAMGLWIAIMALLDSSPWLAVAIVSVLALIRVARIETSVPGWGDAVVHAEGRRFMGETEKFLRARHPVLPRGSRLFFAGVPRGRVFVLGPENTPALRVWYDRSVRGSYWSAYQPRSANQGGADYFFAYDSTRGWREVIRGEEDVAPARGNADWTGDHERLALVLAKAGDLRAAEGEYAKLARAHPERADYAFLAGLSAEAAGNAASALQWYAEAARRPGADADMKARYERMNREAH